VKFYVDFQHFWFIDYQMQLKSIVPPTSVLSPLSKPRTHFQRSANLLPIACIVAVTLGIIGLRLHAD